MNYPINISISVDNVFLEPNINLTFYSGVTAFVGPNGSGKTQVMKHLKTAFSEKFSPQDIRYLSSNRLGTLERYRSRTDQYDYSHEDVTIGDKGAKLQRHSIEVATGDFFTLDERKDVYIKVSERLAKLFGRDVYLEWNNGHLTVYFRRDKFSKQYSLANEASGLINLISILAALYDDEIKVLLIDEPEVSLHPQLQSFLLNEIKKVSGDPAVENKKMIIISTHSTEMIEINNTTDLTKYIFFREDGLSPVQIDPNASVLQNKRLKDLIARFGQVHKNVFFANRPLLVEGISDSIFCNYFDSKLDLNLGVAGVYIVPIDGKGEFGPMIKLMRLLGKKPIVLCDLDAFVDDNHTLSSFSNNEILNIEASSLGHTDINSFIRAVKNNFINLCIEFGVSLREKYENHPYWKNRDSNEELAKRRAIMALLMSSEDSDISTWNNSSKWQGIKNSASALLNCLEKAGCFILRKGAIESYYTFSNQETSSGKPNAAIEEIESLAERDFEFVENSFSDVLRCLKYAAHFKKIDETEQIKLELLSEVAPILEVLNTDTTLKDIESIINKLKGNMKSLFSYEPVIDNDVIKLNVDLKTKIIDVSGFPFVIQKTDNVNLIISSTIKVK